MDTISEYLVLGECLLAKLASGKISIGAFQSKVGTCKLIIGEAVIVRAMELLTVKCVGSAESVLNIVDELKATCSVVQKLVASRRHCSCGPDGSGPS